ncbi:MAG: YeeE/YedE thiosulfate transporter family protein [Bacteroidota bacterium]
MSSIMEPWPWYVSGPLIALIMALLVLVGKRFGMSTNLETLCTLGGAGRRIPYFDIDLKSRNWGLIVVLGAGIGGFLAANFLSANSDVNIASTTIEKLNALGFESAGSAYLPTELFGDAALYEFKVGMLLLVGGFLVGFGARYAGGCTSGHSISGISNLQIPSLIATVGFFLGGLLMIHFLYPIIF